MITHDLTVDGEAQTGDWLCAKCSGRWAYWIDGRGLCGRQRSFPWSPERVGLFRAAIARAAGRGVPAGRSPMSMRQLAGTPGPVAGLPPVPSAGPTHP